MKGIKPRFAEIEKKKKGNKKPKALDSIVRQVLVSHQQSAAAAELFKCCYTHKTLRDILQEAILLWQQPEVCHWHFL